MGVAAAGVAKTAATERTSSAKGIFVKANPFSANEKSAHPRSFCSLLHGKPVAIERRKRVFLTMDGEQTDYGADDPIWINNAWVDTVVVVGLTCFILCLMGLSKVRTNSANDRNEESPTTDATNLSNTHTFCYRSRLPRWECFMELAV